MAQSRNYASKKKGKTEVYPFWNMSDIKNVVEKIREKFLVRQKNRHRQRPHIKMSDNKRNKISVASKAPAVPGAKGEKPEPKPVPIMTGRREGFFIKKVMR